MKKDENLFHAIPFKKKLIFIKKSTLRAFFTSPNQLFVIKNSFFIHSLFAKKHYFLLKNHPTFPDPNPLFHLSKHINSLYAKQRTKTLSSDFQTTTITPTRLFQKKRYSVTVVTVRFSMLKNSN